MELISFLGNVGLVMALVVYVLMAVMNYRIAVDHPLWIIVDERSWKDHGSRSPRFRAYTNRQRAARDGTYGSRYKWAATQLREVEFVALVLMLVNLVFILWYKVGQLF